MKLTPQNGGFVIDAADLGPLLNLPPAEVPALMAAGKITNRFEEGRDADAGRFRVTFLYRNMRLRFTVNATGEVLAQSLITLPPKAPQPSR